MLQRKRERPAHPRGRARIRRGETDEPECARHARLGQTGDPNAEERCIASDRDVFALAEADLVDGAVVKARPLPRPAVADVAAADDGEDQEPVTTAKSNLPSVVRARVPFGVLLSASIPIASKEKVPCTRVSLKVVIVMLPLPSWSSTVK